MLPAARFLIILIAAAPPSAQSAIRSSSTARQSLLREPGLRPPLGFVSDVQRITHLQQ
jgi:hypothetical protein